MQLTRIQLKFGVKHRCFLQLDRIEFGSCSHIKRTVPEATSSTRSRSGCFGPHPSAIDVFTPSQKNCTKGVNAIGFNSTKLHKAGVKLPLICYVLEGALTNPHNICFTHDEDLDHLENSCGKSRGPVFLQPHS